MGYFEKQKWDDNKDLVPNLHVELPNILGGQIRRTRMSAGANQGNSTRTWLKMNARYQQTQS